MKKLLLFLIILVTSVFVYPQITFQKIYGGAYYYEGASVMQTTDGGYIITGDNKSSVPLCGPSHVYVIKTSSNGDTLWSKIYGGLGPDIGSSI